MTASIIGDCIIFLDFDGVLNSVGSSLAFGTWQTFDRVSVKLVERLAEQTNAEVVISSSWRIGTSLDYLRAVLVSNGGAELATRVTDKTPQLATKRGTEIAAWLGKNGVGRPYVILDDDSDMLDGQLCRFVQANVRDGFRLTEYHRAMRVLHPNHKDVSALMQFAAPAKKLDFA